MINVESPVMEDNQDVVEAVTPLPSAVEASKPNTPSATQLADEAADGIHLTDHQLAKARQRHAWLRGCREYFALGYSMNQAAGQFPDFSLATLSRLLSLAEVALGPSSTPMDRADWLLRQPLQTLVPNVSPGRKPAHPLTEEEALALRGLTLVRSTQNDHTTANHFTMAVEEFLGHAACTPETRAFIRERLDAAARDSRMVTWPDSWRRAAYPTRQETAKFRGVKSSQRVEHTDRRAMNWRDEDGNLLPVLPHTIWEMDDASDNEPRVSIDPESGEATITRQALWTQDVHSAAVLGFSQVARERDAYRIEDVADHVRNCIHAWGLPTFLRLEQGKIWNGSFFHGIKPGLPGWGEDETWGGLSPLVRVENTFKSRGKIIEKSFDLLQAKQAHAAMSLGRVRGEFEVATKALVRAHGTGNIDARFWDMTKAADYTQQICEWFNAKPKVRRDFGKAPVVPNDLLRGAKGPQPPATELWRLCPIKRVATVRGGHVEMMVRNYAQAFRFRVNGTDRELHLDHGYSVLVAFHPGRPEEGCSIFNAELGPRNRESFKRGEFLLQAPLAEDVPQIDLSGRSDFGPRKKANAAVIRNFRAIGQAVRATHSQDSQGSVRRAEVGTQQPDGSPAAVEAPKARREANPFRYATEEDSAKQSARLEKLAAALAPQEPVYDLE